MQRLLAGISAILFGFLFILPWILVRKGIYHSWYLAHFAPPFIWGRVIYAWPISIVFISIPIVALLPINDDKFTSLMGAINIIRVILSIYMIGWTPRWAKPPWQRYLEDQYTWSEIRGTFIPAWRKMDRKEWATLLDSEAGIRELVRRARQSKQA